VGIQCVDCVKAAAKEARSTQTVFGGRATDGTPIVTYLLIGICAVAYIAQKASPNVTFDFAFVPALGWTEPWRFVTAAFLHSPDFLLHIVFNMMALWTLGQYLEPLLGRARFAALYVISAFGGQVAVTLLAGSPTVESLNANAAAGLDDRWLTSVVGASGAIFGLFGALLVLNRHLGRSSAGMYATIAINAAISLMPGIAWQAHLGGFVTGLACAGGIAIFRKRENRQLAWVALGAVLALLAVVVVAKYLSLPEAVRMISSDDFGR
jgi:membrane associated rhomboid family serine protease